MLALPWLRGASQVRAVCISDGARAGLRVKVLSGSGPCTYRIAKDREVGFVLTRLYCSSFKLGRMIFPLEVYRAEEKNHNFSVQAMNEQQW